MSEKRAKKTRTKKEVELMQGFFELELLRLGGSESASMDPVKAGCITPAMCDIMLDILQEVKALRFKIQKIGHDKAELKKKVANLERMILNRGAGK